MGLIVYLGHKGCLMPKNGPASFTVVHTNGIHDVHVVFCGCGDAVHPRHQLLRRGWFPATIHQPQTCDLFGDWNYRKNVGLGEWLGEHYN